MVILPDKPLGLKVLPATPEPENVPPEGEADNVTALALLHNGATAVMVGVAGVL